MYQKTLFDALSSFQSQVTGENLFQQFQMPQQQQQNVYIDPSIHGMFQDQYRLEESFASQKIEFQPNEQEYLEQASQIMDPAMMTPEYMQMFNQFYQLFSQLQTLQQQDNENMDFMNNETFIQNLMLAFFQQQQTMNQQLSQQVAPCSPKNNNHRDYCNNLPLAAIPESKESILEENSGWNTVKSNKFKLLMSAGSNMGQDNGCNCCQNCQELKKRGIYSQQCSGFNVGSNSNQINQETFLQRSELQSATKTSQIFSNGFNLPPCTPSPKNFDNQGFQAMNNLASLQISQNLDQLFQMQQQFQMNQFQNQQPYELQQPLFGTQIDPNQHQNIIDQYMKISSALQSPQQQHKTQPSSAMMSPNFLKQASQINEQALSPKQIQETKLIEYMLENDDYSTYKQRRLALKGERMCRTLSRGGNGNQGYSSQPQIQQLNFSSSQNFQNFQQYSIAGPKYSNDNRINNENFRLENYNKEALQFFSPQVTNKQQQFFDKKSSMPENYLDQNRVSSPEIEGFKDLQSYQGTTKRKRTQEKIKEIRRINELRENRMQNKSKQKNKNSKQQQKQVFEIKDLKKSQTRKNNHVRKQSCNVQNNKENCKLLQSNYQNHYEISHEQIMMSPNQDLLAQSEIEQNHQSKKDLNTFKSLNSVWNSRIHQENISQQNNLDQSPQIAKILNIENVKKQSIHSLTDQQSNTNLNQIRARPESVDLNAFLNQEGLENKKPGQEIHIIKKPKETEEFKKIQERLNKYYQNKKRDEEKQKKNDNQNRRSSRNNQQQHFQNENETLSMTKTLSSFKSLMMKTMSQMSMQQDLNLCNQYIQGKEQRAKGGFTRNNQAQNTNCNQSVNVSSIQDDISCGGEISENLSKMISPKNLYNGSLANIKQRNPQIANEISLTPTGDILSPGTQRKEDLTSQNQKQSCLPNSLFFNQKNKNTEDTLSLKYNSRQPSLCYCGKMNCLCDQNSKKDLLSHFQNFLSEMDKHQIKQGQKGSLLSSPINDNNCNTNSTQDFFLSNFQILGLGRSSSQTSRVNKPYSGSNRQSSICPQSNMIQSIHKMKRFSSGSQLPNLPLKKMSHCQSTQQIKNTKNILLNNCGDSNNSMKKIKTTDNQEKEANQSHSELEKLDTNKEEEMRLVNLENDIMQKNFIKKSHKLNLENSQREELLLRIQKHKREQMSTKNNSVAVNEGEMSHNCVATTQNTSQFTGSQYNGSVFNGLQQKHSRQRSDNAQNCSINSLEERRLIGKYMKKVENIKENQIERQTIIDSQERQLEFY